MHSFFVGISNVLRCQEVDLGRVLVRQMGFSTHHAIFRLHIRRHDASSHCSSYLGSLQFIALCAVLTEIKLRAASFYDPEFMVVPATTS
jgi:hypothetical protein